MPPGGGVTFTVIPVSDLESTDTVTPRVLRAVMQLAVSALSRRFSIVLVPSAAPAMRRALIEWDLEEGTVTRRPVTAAG